MAYTLQVQESLDDRQSKLTSELTSETEETPSAIELFSYGVCCVTQGVMGILYFALITLVPIALHQGIF